MERRWREADDHPHGEKSRWKEAIVVQCGWTRQGVVRDEAGIEAEPLYVRPRDLYFILYSQK